MSTPFELAEPRRRKPTIQLSALIDVVFILMIFVILGANFERLRGMEVDVPRTDTSEAATLGVVVEIPAEGPVRVEGQPVSDLDTLTERLRARRTEARTVTLRADQTVPLQRAMDVFDAARAAGFEGIDLVTRPRSPGRVSP